MCFIDLFFHFTLKSSSSFSPMSSICFEFWCPHSIKILFISKGKYRRSRRCTIILILLILKFLQYVFPLCFHFLFEISKWISLNINNHLLISEFNFILFYFRLQLFDLIIKCLNVFRVWFFWYLCTSSEVWWLNYW